MGSFPLIPIAAYSIGELQERPQHSWSGLKFVKAIKGQSFNGYADIVVERKWVRLEESNAAEVYGWFAELAAPRVKALGIAPAVIVPVPPSALVVRAPIAGPPWQCATALAQKLGVRAVDALRWKRPMQSARSGGARRASVLYPNLEVIKPSEAGACILVDDVTTSGGHIHACAGALEAAGYEVLAAVVAGKTMRDEIPDHSFNLPNEVAQAYDPDDFDDTFEFDD